LTAEEAVIKDIDDYKAKGGTVKLPFPIEDFALRTFGLDIQYEDFSKVFSSDIYECDALFGCLFPDKRFFQGIDKVILINTTRKDFTLGGQVINPVYWKDFAERQTIAHEVGHYSDKYINNRANNPEASQLDLFLPTVIADDPSSIIVYPVGAETFANKYSRTLLMPEQSVHEFITKKGITGSFDLNSIISEIKEYFGVTQYMIEIRLHELSIHFTNGIYIKNGNRYPYKKYTENDLLTLIDVVKNYGLTHPYYDADNFVHEYNLKTGETRASAALYYAFTRIINGVYDERYPSVFEKRVTELSDFNVDKLSSLDPESE
jgi:hypothetical protein